MAMIAESRCIERHCGDALLRRRRGGIDQKTAHYRMVCRGDGQGLGSKRWNPLEAVSA